MWSKSSYIPSCKTGISYTSENGRKPCQVCKKELSSWLSALVYFMPSKMCAFLSRLVSRPAECGIQFLSIAFSSTLLLWICIWDASRQNQHNETQISLDIRPVWSESSISAQWVHVAKDPSLLHTDSEDWSDWASAQADLSLRWEHMPLCWFCREAAHFVLFVLTAFLLVLNTCVTFTLAWWPLSVRTYRSNMVFHALTFARSRGRC